MKLDHRLAILAALAFLPVIPYALLGYAGQDLPFHVMSWVEVSGAHFALGWSPGANFGLGDPHLLFYPPISMYLGATLASVLPISIAPAVLIWIAVWLSGCAMYLASGDFLSGKDRLTAAILYMLNPYLLTTAMVRFAVAELLVQAVLPLIVLYLYRAICEADARRRNGAMLMLGVLFAAAWLTDLPAAIVLLYGLLPVAVFAAWLRRSPAPVLRFAVAEAVAVLMAGFYLAPAWVEQRWINHDALVRHDPGQQLLFMPQARPAESVMIFACWIFLLAGAIVFAVSLRGRSMPLRADGASRLFVSIAAVSVAFQLPFAYALWHHLPELAAAQFPFRFLPLLFVALPLLLLSEAIRRPLRRPAYVLLGVVTVLPFLGFAAMQTSTASRQPSLSGRVAKWRNEGYAGAPEYLPAGATLPRLPLGSRVLEEQKNSTLSADGIRCSSTVAVANPLRAFDHIANSCSVPARLLLPVFFYPYWQAADEGGHAVPVTRDSSGLIAMEIPPGSHDLTLNFHPVSRARSASGMVSALALLLVGVAIFFTRRVHGQDLGT